MRPNQLLFSVVIPTYNRSRQLCECLEALMAQDLPAQSFEVILVDDGGHEPLEETLAPFRESLEISLLRQSHRGCAAARQLGIEHASGEYLAFTDDDCRPSPHWLSTMAALLREHPGCAAGGSTVNGLVDDPFAEATQMVVRTLTEWSRDRAGFVPYCPTSNAAFPAEALRSVGGLDPTWNIAGGEDRDLCARWSNAGRRLVYTPEACVFHFHRLTLGQFVIQHFSYGRGATRFFRVNETSEQQGLRSHRVGFYLNLFRGPFLAHPPKLAALIFGLILLAQIATAAGMISEACSPAGRRSAQRLPVRP
jgi:GT2 family glycosyltransferase